MATLLGRGHVQVARVGQVRALGLGQKKAAGLHLLQNTHHAQTGQFQHREQGHDNLVAQLHLGHIRAHQILEADHALTAFEQIHNLVDAVGDRHAIHDHVVGVLRFGLLQHLRPVLQELPHRMLGQAGFARWFKNRAAHEDVAALDRAIAQVLGRMLVLLVLEQAADQLFARVDGVFTVLAGFQRLGRRHQFARLEVGQVRGHHQVVGRHFDRHVLHELQVLDVLLGDERDGDVENIELVGLAQVEQQIERALELGQSHAVGGVALGIVRQGGRHGICRRG